MSVTNSTFQGNHSLIEFDKIVPFYSKTNQNNSVSLSLLTSFHFFLVFKQNITECEREMKLTQKASTFFLLTFFTFIAEGYSNKTNVTHMKGNHLIAASSNVIYYLIKIYIFLGFSRMVYRSSQQLLPRRGILLDISLV